MLSEPDELDTPDEFQSTEATRCITLDAWNERGEASEPASRPGYFI